MPQKPRKVSSCKPPAEGVGRVSGREEAPRGTTTERGYGWAWQKARARFLAANPLCAACLRHGLAVPAVAVDHVEPHRGDKDSFWNGRWEALCVPCHNKKSAREGVSRRS